MRRVLLLLILVLCAGGVSQPLLAQKTAPQITRDGDRDGVPDVRDTCARTPLNTRVDARGCPEAAPATPATTTTAPVTTPTPTPLAVVPPAANPAPANATQPRPDTTRLRPTGMPAPAGATGQPVTQATPGTTGTTPANTAANPPATPPNAATRPATPGGAPAGPTLGVAPPAVTAPVAPPPAVTTPPATPTRPAATPAPAPQPAAPVVDPSETIGLWIPAYTGRTDADQLEYVRSLVIKLDSAVLALVETFRGTSGTPLAGATDPGKLSRREKDRWLRCRNITNDLKTMADAAGLLKDSVAGGAALQRAVGTLAGAFESMQALESCDVVNGMIEFPERANPWGPNYESEARNFYRDWYLQVRAVHGAARDVVRALNPALPLARRIGVPAAIATTPPYSGAAR